MKMLTYVLFVISVLPVVTSQDCSASSVSTCLKAFVGSRVIDSSIPPIDADVPAWNETFAQLKDRCQRYSRFSTCMETVLPSCPVNSTELFSGWDSAYKNQLCRTDDALQQFLQYEQCYQQPEVLLGTKFCNDTYYAKLASLRTGPSSAIRTNFCSFTDNYLDCLKTVVTEQCTKNASTWIYDWNVALRSKQMTDYSCPGWQDTPSSDTIGATTWTIILAVPLALTLIVVIIGIIVIVVLTHRKKKAPVRRASLLAPPPYSSNPHMSFGPECGVEGATAEGPSWGTDTLFKFPVVQPPPYVDPMTPAYDNVNTDIPVGGATAGAGDVNPAFTSEELGAVGGTPAFSSPTTTTAAAVAVTESERELNTSWF